MVRFWFMTFVASSSVCLFAGEDESKYERRPVNDAERRFWLENMVRRHRFSVAEVASATGLSPVEIDASLKKFSISPATKAHREKGDPLMMLPYPGGRHPRIGFLEGAVRPQRETKISVFTPWDDASYVVVDLPEAVWSNLGLTYLAHTHVPTIWSTKGISLEPLEWNRRPLGDLEITRRLPNGISFGAKAKTSKEAVHMELWLTNNTKEVLSDLRVQTCVMLKGAKGFEQQTNDNKVISTPYVACHSADKKRWVITAWSPVFRSWTNAQCPCLHSDPKFPDCKPGETQRLNGWLSFYEGADIEVEIRRIDAMGWRK